MILRNQLWKNMDDDTCCICGDCFSEKNEQKNDLESLTHTQNWHFVCVWGLSNHFFIHFFLKNRPHILQFCVCEGFLLTILCVCRATESFFHSFFSENRPPYYNFFVCGGISHRATESFFTRVFCENHDIPVSKFQKCLSNKPYITKKRAILIRNHQKSKLYFFFSFIHKKSTN